MVLNILNLYFKFVSDFDIRISKLLNQSEGLSLRYALCAMLGLETRRTKDKGQRSKDKGQRLKDKNMSFRT